jgi:hypothetical protein
VAKPTPHDTTRIVGAPMSSLLNKNDLKRSCLVLQAGGLTAISRWLSEATPPVPCLALTRSHRIPLLLPLPPAKRQEPLPRECRLTVIGHWDLTSDSRQCVVSTQSNERAEDTMSLGRGRSAPFYANARTSSSRRRTIESCICYATCQVSAY